MLVITRKAGESVKIHLNGSEVRVMVVNIKGDKSIRLGFQAGNEVVILRDELAAPSFDKVAPLARKNKHLAASSLN